MTLPARSSLINLFVAASLLACLAGNALGAVKEGRRHGDFAEVEHGGFEGAGMEEEKPFGLNPEGLMGWAQNLGQTFADFGSNKNSGRKAAPQAEAPYVEKSGGGGGGKKGLEKTEKVVVKDKVSFDLIADWPKLFMNPIEFVKGVCGFFGIPFEKTTEMLGKSLVFGMETFFQPMIVSLKIMEKIFVPGACNLKFLCNVGTGFGMMRDSVSRFSPNFLEGSVQMKALFDGVMGKDCLAVYSHCSSGPQLAKPFAALRGEIKETESVEVSEKVRRD